MDFAVPPIRSRYRRRNAYCRSTAESYPARRRWEHWRSALPPSPRLLPHALRTDLSRTSLHDTGAPCDHQLLIVRGCRFVSTDILHARPDGPAVRCPRSRGKSKTAQAYLVEFELGRQASPAALRRPVPTPVPAAYVSRRLAALEANDEPITKQRAARNDGLIWPHCDGLNWPHLVRWSADAPVLIERGSGAGRKWDPEWNSSSRSVVIASVRTCRCARWPSVMGCIAGPSGRRLRRRCRRRRGCRCRGRRRSSARIAS